jgi:hypothetical protein
MIKKKKWWLVCVKGSKNKTKQEKKPMCQHLKVYIYLQVNIIFICLLCCSYMKNNQIENASIDILISKIRFMNGVYFKIFYGVEI